MPTLDSTVAAIRPPDESLAAEAKRRLDDKTKPVGSLGRLEELAARLVAIQGMLVPETQPRAVVVMAADHGVVARGVSAYPQTVTAQMVRNFAAGGAAINVLARVVGARVVVVDMGVAGSPAWGSGVLSRAIRPGTADLASGPAMSVAEARRAVEQGIAMAAELAAEGVRVLATGEMGIGNTTSAAVLTAVFTGRPANEVTGRGTGIDDRQLTAKIAVVERALALHRPSATDPLEALAAVGGLEIAGLAGLVLGAAARRIPVVLDGFIAGAAALVAVALAPAVRGSLLAGHRSAERGHVACLAALRLEPLLDLGLRLGEGTGAALALPLLDAAARVLIDMASFGAAGVDRRSP